VTSKSGFALDRAPISDIVTTAPDPITNALGQNGFSRKDAVEAWR
jgi:hypothetical protein